MPHKQIDGYISVTQVIGSLDKAWKWSWYRSAVRKAGHNGWLACDEASRLGMENGTAFHAEIEGYLLRKEPMSERFGAFERWYSQANLIPLVIEPEEPYRCEKLKLQGTMDYLEDKDGLTIPWDWKYSKQMSNDYGLQLSAYAYLAGVKEHKTEKETWKNSPYGKVGWLNKETGDFLPVTYEPLEKYWRVFKGLVYAGHYLRGIGEWAK